MADWISVKDRLPELPDGKWTNRMVIACCNGEVLPMIYERAFVRGKSVERWKYYWDRIANIEPTHWMPLPEPPEEEMDCPDTHKDVIAQLCSLHYYPGVGCGCASAAACNHHFRLWLKTEPEVQQLHSEYQNGKENDHD